MVVEMNKRVITVTVAAAAAGIWLGIRWANASSRSTAKPPAAGRLAECPNKPNCVSTQATDASQQIEPLAMAASPEESLAKLRRVIQSMPRARIVTDQDGYLHAEFRSLVFGFIDDVEFLADPSSQTIQCRSASRVGHSDLGVNRKRVEQIRKLYAAEGES